MACGSAEDDGCGTLALPPFFMVSAGVLRETRDTPPAHYVLKVKSFSLFSKNGVNQIKSNSFQVGEYQWKIILFPKGKNGGKDDHVSVYLMLDSTSSLSAGKGINAFFKFFLLDQIRGNYLTVQGRQSRFDSLKCEWGLDKFVSLKVFKEPTNGYLVDDTSFFGVEVFVSEGPLLGECHSVSEVANISGKHKWVITQFSELGEPRDSDEFVVGGYKWKLSLYPEGISKHKDFSLSLYLVSVDSESSTTEHKVKAEYAVTLEDQFKQNHKQRKTTNWFGSSRPDWGWPSFIELKDLKDDEKGYIVADQCIIEAEITVLCEGSRETLKC